MKNFVHKSEETDFVLKNDDLLINLWSRWQDEKEYEDIADYGARIAKEFPEGWKLVKSHKRPFGVTFDTGKAKFQIKVTSTSLSMVKVR